MSSIIFKITLPMSLVFSAVALLIQMQPHDNPDLRGFLLSQSCEMPCFMGIQPGVTTVEEAVKLLQTSSWVERVKGDPTTLGISAITWTWSENKPAFIRAGSTGLLLSHMDDNQRNIIDKVQIDTTVPVGYFSLLLYNEAAPVISNANGSIQKPVMQITDYSLSIRLSSALSCPITMHQMFNEEAIIEFDRRTILGSEPKNQGAGAAFYWCGKYGNRLWGG
jgi:hypothetical protein